MHKWCKTTKTHNHNGKKKTNFKNWEKFQRLVDQWLYQHSHYRGPRKIKEREGHEKNLNHEILSENFESLNKETDIQVQKAQKVQNKMNSKDLHQDIIKMANLKLQRNTCNGIKGKTKTNIQGNPK